MITSSSGEYDVSWVGDTLPPGIFQLDIRLAASPVAALAGELVPERVRLAMTDNDQLAPVRVGSNPFILAR